MNAIVYCAIHFEVPCIYILIAVCCFNCTVASFLKLALNLIETPRCSKQKTCGNVLDFLKGTLSQFLYLFIHKRTQMLQNINLTMSCRYRLSDFKRCSK